MARCFRHAADGPGDGGLPGARAVPPGTATPHCQCGVDRPCAPYFFSASFLSLHVARDHRTIRTVPWTNGPSQLPPFLDFLSLPEPELFSCFLRNSILKFKNLHPGGAAALSGQALPPPPASPSTHLLRSAPQLLPLMPPPAPGARGRPADIGGQRGGPGHDGRGGGTAHPRPGRYHDRARGVHPEPQPLNPHATRPKHSKR